MMKKQKMTDENLNAFLSNELENCIGHHLQSDVVAERTKALKYYLNLPRGDEEEYRSRIQDSTVNDVIESFLPGLLAPFLSDEDVVEFVPRRTNDNDMAKQQTKLVNHVIMKDNQGDKVLYQFGKDGLLQKNGFLYVDWTEKECVTLRTKRGSLADLEAIRNNPTNELIKVMVEINDRFVEQKEFAKLPPEQLMEARFEFKYRERKQEGRVKIANIPPEYMLVHRDAELLDEPRIIGWMERKTISELRQEGYDTDQIDKLIAATHDDGDLTGERALRQQKQSGVSENYDESSTDIASRRVWITVLFTHVDFDGDGYAEYRKIIRAGKGTNTQSIIMYNEEIDTCPIISWTPIIMPHQYFGRSLADLCIEVQDMKTALMRAMMNATYDIEPSYVVSETSLGSSTLDDLYNRQPRSLILTNDVNGIRELSENTPDISNAYQFLQYADYIRETRTPVTRMMQAVDPDLLNDKTATEATIQSNASMQRQELIIRLFASAIKELCVKTHQLLLKYQHESRWIRITENQEPMQTNPQEWDAEMDVIVKVGLGTGTKQQQMQHLMMIRQMQMEDLQLGLPTVSPDKIVSTEHQLVAMANLGNGDIYFNDVPAPENQDDDMQQQIQQAQAQAFEEGREAGGQEAAEQLKAQEKQMQAQKIQMDAAGKQMEMQHKQQEHSDKMQLDVIKEQNKAALDAAKLELETLKIIREANDVERQNRTFG
jgi:hypothetical protein